jgi:hypothetical protein
LSAVAARKALTSQAGGPSKASKGLNGNESLEDDFTESKSLASGLPNAGLDAQDEATNAGITNEESVDVDTFMNFVKETQPASYARHPPFLPDTCSEIDFCEGLNHVPSLQR